MLKLGVYLATVFAVTYAVLDTDNLDQAHVIFRHGARSPRKKVDFDPLWKIWPQGPGQLLPEGTRQSFDLGSFLKDYYMKFLNSAYRKTEVNIRSTDKDRTLMSAQAVLAGLFPPKGDQVWNTELPWQPVPIHTVPLHKDYLLSSDATCPVYQKKRKSVFNSTVFQQWISEFKSDATFLLNKTGLPKSTNFSDILDWSFDALNSMQQYMYPLPAWANNSLFTKLKNEFMPNLFNFEVCEPDLKLQAGPFMKEMFTNMKAKQEGTSKTKLHLYSAHDSTLTYVMCALGVYDFKYVSESTVLMIHLYKNGSVNVLRRNRTMFEPEEMTINGCGKMCMFSKLLKMKDTLFPKDIEAECGVSTAENTGAVTPVKAEENGGTALAVFLVAGAVLVVIVAAVYIRHRRNKNKYQLIVDGESESLVK